LQVTKHALDRLKERLGLPRSAALRMATKAYNSGLKHGDLNGRLERYVSGITKCHMVKGAKVRLYGHHVFCFVENPDDNEATLVTVYELPKSLLAHSLGKQKKLKK
jgi:hypothetical protein